MDSNTFNHKLAKNLNLPSDRTQELLAQAVSLVTSALADMDSVALPGFGEFVPQKYESTVETDPLSGTQMILPPKIVVNFRPSTALQKRLSK